ncbi:hypothetical protein BOTBODRAFT_29165 [Botryobasidium botryosum FD-172 SS1]|uniref:BTB domain-containing protein n=1 Tax=Botryobasidium botryosum (strain FD-172 SS1) TaxID=930990 RepID=A0A067MT46_BOTB1|nr:hypothetical protein BOTBODRAFT_29165 [Botryobasidium botryosum FD-172 SS1]
MTNNNSSQPATSGDTTVELPSANNSLATPSSESMDLVARQNTQDPEYYFEDGSIVILVETTLFRVHRSILIRGSSLFETMLTLPPSTGNTHPGDNAEGSSDDHPLTLHGETATQFRALLWSLYASPHETAALHNSRDIAQLLCIASVAHKYNFEGIESWSADLMVEIYNNIPFTYQFLPLLDYAILSDKARLRESVLGRLRRSVSSRSISLTRLILYADGKDHQAWKDLLGLSLYRYVIRGPRSWVADGTSLPKDKRTMLYVAFGKLLDIRMVESHGRIRARMPRAVGLSFKSSLSARRP